MIYQGCSCFTARPEMAGSHSVAHRLPSLSDKASVSGRNLFLPAVLLMSSAGDRLLIFSPADGMRL